MVMANCWRAACTPVPAEQGFRLLRVDTSASLWTEVSLAPR
jgi:hypothetical protein